MGNFTVAGGLFIKVIVIGLPVLLLLLLFKNRPNKFSAILLSVLLLLTVTIGLFFFLVGAKERNKLSNKFVGFYKLNKLNCEECINCRIELHEDYRYEIIQNSKIVGDGEWSIEMNPETGYFLKIENGPSYINHEPDGQIENISTTVCR